MKDSTIQVARGSVAETADDVRVTNAVQSDRFVLEILDQRPLQIVVKIVLEKDIQGLYHDLLMRRLKRCKDIVGEIDLGIAASAKLLVNIVSAVESAVN